MLVVSGTNQGFWILFSGLISAYLSITRVRVLGLEVPTGSSLEQKLVIEPIPFFKVASFRVIMKLWQHPHTSPVVVFKYSDEHSLPFLKFSQSK